MREDERHEHDSTTTTRAGDRLLPILRTFAFLLITTAHRATARRSKDHDQQIRNFGIGVKATRSCLDRDELELALKLLESCAEHVSTADVESPLVRIANDMDEEVERKTKLAILNSKYYLLRMTHAWKSDRLDLAEHFFNKFSSCATNHAPTVAEMAAELCLDAGRSLSKRGPSETSIKWLERAISILDGCDIEQLSLDAGELRLSIVTAVGEYVHV
jgi:hypothetical protein